ncbi:MAG: porin [Roseobacter sp.]|jgi:outer membrane protein OmpU|nr:porin [Roseobacter sp.]
MKKLLIATTALVGSAGVVAADISFNGYGRFGILYEEDRGDGALEDTRLESRYRLNIDTSTETDGGVRFAARIRVQADDNSDGTVDAGSFSGARFQVSAGGFRVRVGNVSGVHDAAEVVNFFGFEPGLIGQIGHYSTFGGGPIDAFSASSPGGAEGNGGVNGINVKYEAGAFAVMASYSEDFDENDGSTSVGDYEAFEIGASYEIIGWTFGVGYGMADFGDANGDTGVDTDFWTVTATGAIGPADVAFFLGDSDDEFNTDDDLAYGVSGSIPVGASTNIVASYAGGGRDSIDDAYGIGFTHSLGGGVNLSGMVGRQTNENTIADLGVRFDF